MCASTRLVSDIRPVFTILGSVPAYYLIPGHCLQFLC